MRSHKIATTPRHTRNIVQRFFLKAHERLISVQSRELPVPVIRHDLTSQILGVPSTPALEADIKIGWRGTCPGAIPYMRPIHQLFIPP